MDWMECLSLCMPVCSLVNFKIFILIYLACYLVMLVWLHIFQNTDLNSKEKTIANKINQKNKQSMEIVTKTIRCLLIKME